MPAHPSEYESFLRPGDIVNLGIDLPGKTFVEDFATVVRVVADGILLRICGAGFPGHLRMTGGEAVVLSKVEGKTVFHCTTCLQEPVDEGACRIGLPDKVSIYERREYQRADVLLPVFYCLPESQRMEKVIARWELMRGCCEQCAADATAVTRRGDTRVNLGGSGIRFKIRDCFSYGTLLHLNIILPGGAAEHIHAIGSIIRTKELLPEMDHIEYYSTSLAFRVVENSDRLRLMKYLFAAQHQTHIARESRYL